MPSLNIAMAQINPLVGDIPGNTAKVLDYAQQAQAQGADVVIFPELVLSGYPPEDLLFRQSLALRIERALAQLQEAELGITLVLGYPRTVAGRLFNTGGVITKGKLVYEYAKQQLPNGPVADEVRYFTPGERPGVFSLHGVSAALTLGEEVEQPAPIEQARAAGATLMLNLSASPFERGKPAQREQRLAERARQGQMPIVYVNQVGGQDEWVFDGGSVAVNASGEVCRRLPAWTEALELVGVNEREGRSSMAPQALAPPQQDLDSVYQALVTGMRDYVTKNGFKAVVLGLSGGLDSALTLAIAVDALGPERVTAIMMPFRYTSDMSQTDAAEQARRMGVSYHSLSIEPLYDAFMGTLEPVFPGTAPDTTEENLQARCRGVLLMAWSNKKGDLVLTTGNKSELAVGYSTLYGDMAGGFGVLKDVPKTLVFALSRYRNSLSEVIPPNVISRPPSAELAPDQKDEDSLPPYSELDEILALYIEQDYSAEAIIEQGFARHSVERAVRLVDLNEYKRRQAPIGVRIAPRGFGSDRRYPITSGWRLGD